MEHCLFIIETKYYSLFFNLLLYELLKNLIIITEKKFELKSTCIKILILLYK